MVTTVPAGPATRSRSHPVAFWPRSKIHTPGLGWVTATGVRSCWTLTPSSTWDTSFGAASVRTVTAPHELSLKPALSHPPGRRRASYFSPICMSSSVIGPAVYFQLLSVPMTCEVPSV